MKWKFCTIWFLTITTAYAQNKAAVISSKDFTPALGSLKGTLTYLDYTSGKPYTMPANAVITVNSANSNQIILALEYPEESKANGNDTLVISMDGVFLNSGKLVSKNQLQDGSLEIITDNEGSDGNDHKKAILRHIYTIGKTKFSNRKEVKFVGTDKWILRNEYSFYR